MINVKEKMGEEYTVSSSTPSWRISISHVYIKIILKVKYVFNHYILFYSKKIIVSFILYFKLLKEFL
jgi:hypothetical protein